MYIPIDPTREYTPSEIFKYGFIVNTVGKPDYRYILRLVEAGKLRARNICKGTKGKYYKISGQDILTWKQSTYTVPIQPSEIQRKKRERHPYPQASVPNGQE